MRDTSGCLTCTFCVSLRYAVRVEWTPEAIKRARQERHWNQQQLADALGYSKGAVSAWERGVNPPQSTVELDRVLGQPTETVISSGEVSVAAPSLPEASNLELVEELLRRLNRADHRGSPSGPVDLHVDDPGSTGSTSAQ